MSDLLHPSVIKQIAKEVDLGNTCYIHRFTRKLTTIDQTADDKSSYAQQTLQQQLELKIEQYVKVEKPSDDDQLEIMEYFLEEIPDKSIRKQLSNAIKRQNPIRNFNQAIDSNIELTVHWANFKREEYQRWVSNVIIDAYNY